MELISIYITCCLLHKFISEQHRFFTAINTVNKHFTKTLFASYSHHTKFTTSKCRDSFKRHYRHQDRSPKPQRRATSRSAFYLATLHGSSSRHLSQCLYSKKRFNSPNTHPPIPTSSPGVSTLPLAPRTTDSRPLFFPKPNSQSPASRPYQLLSSTTAPILANKYTTKAWVSLEKISLVGKQQC